MSDLQARVWVAGELVVDETLSGAPADVVAQVERHRALVDAAIDAGEGWLVEITDPDREVPTLRFGSDVARMHSPTPVDLPVALEALRDGSGTVFGRRLDGRDG